MPQQDTRDADTILATIAAEARAAWQAEFDFFEWRADHESTMSAEYFRRYAEWVERCEPYARSYARIAKTFPEQFLKLKAVLKPIQRVIL
jgi:hypothetical protein